MSSLCELPLYHRSPLPHWPTRQASALSCRLPCAAPYAPDACPRHSALRPVALPRACPPPWPAPLELNLRPRAPRPLRSAINRCLFGSRNDLPSLFFQKRPQSPWPSMSAAVSFHGVSLPFSSPAPYKEESKAPSKPLRVSLLPHLVPLLRSKQSSGRPLDSPARSHPRAPP
jgi:hypothetical protein